MKYATGADFRRALETRLRTLSQRDAVPIMRLRKLIAFDRLLARLLYLEPDAWVLKGGLALQLRLGARARTTKDMDVMWRRSVGDLHHLLVDAASLDIDDWFRFLVEQPQPVEAVQRFVDPVLQKLPLPRSPDHPMPAFVFAMQPDHGHAVIAYTTTKTLTISIHGL